MESDFSLKTLLSTIENKFSAEDRIKSEDKRPLLDFIKQIKNEDEGKKINLIVLGDTSVGKTVVSNHLIYYLIDQEFNGCFGLPTNIIENTYFVYFIENSESNEFEVLIEIKSYEDRQILRKTNALKDKNFDSNDQMFIKFPSTEEGIKSLNSFLENLDDNCTELLKRLRKNDFDKDQINSEPFTPSKMTIKIPNFSKKYRIIDSPGLSTPSFAEGFIKTVKETNYINFFIIVSDIFLQKSYQLSDEIIRQVTNKYGCPIIYSFITKGNKFLQDYPTIDREYKGIVKNNNLYFKSLDEIIEKGTKFRKIYPINDKIYNDDIKEILLLFFSDLELICCEYGIANYEVSVLWRSRNIIFETNDRMGEVSLFSDNEKNSFREKRIISQNFHNAELNTYFNLLDKFENYKDKFPDQIDKLNKIYEKNETQNKEEISRSTYINIHIKLAFKEFQRIILGKAWQIALDSCKKFSDELPEETKKKIFERISDEYYSEKLSATDLGTVIATYVFTGFFVIGTGSLLAFGGMRIVGFLAAETLSYLIGAGIVPVVGWAIAGIGFLVTFNDHLGLWLKCYTRDDISKQMFNWFLKNKAKINDELKSSFESIIEKFVAKLFNMKEKLPWVDEFLKLCNKFKQTEKGFPKIDYKEELIKIIRNERLKEFFQNVKDF